MLGQSRAYATFSTNDVAPARAFYGETLGLDVEERMGGLAVHLAGGTEVFVYPKDDHEPATFTVLNFPVDDVEGVVDRMTAAGITFEQYEHLGTDAKGIARPEGGPAGIAWFKDPAGNVLSVLQE